MVNARHGKEISNYHLEGGIAFWHTVPGETHKWEHILQLYNRLILIKYSPVTSLNRVLAFAKVYGNRKAIKETEKTGPEKTAAFHALPGYLHKDNNLDKTITHYSSAVELTSPTEKKKH